MRGKTSFNDLLYQGYELSSRLKFDINLKNSKYHPKKKVLGIELDGKAKDYVFSELSSSQSTVKDILKNILIQIYFDRQNQAAVIRGDKNKELLAVKGFWFAYYAFHPAKNLCCGAKLMKGKGCPIVKR